MLLQVADITRYCEGELLCGSGEQLVRGLSWDSRSITPDCLYAALPGERVDGHDYCEDAARSGAAAVLVSRELDAQAFEAIKETGACIIRVADTAVALTALAAAWRARLQGQVIALTGSSGKTTTKNLVRDVLAKAGTVVATQGNQNNELGVPATLLSAEETTDFVVVEMGMRGLGQIAELCEFARPTAALVTNVGTSHMELLGSRDAIAQAKAEVFALLEPGAGAAFVNASEDLLDALLSYGGLVERGVQTIFFDGSGKDPESYATHTPSIYASDISYDAAGNPRFIIHTETSQAPCALQLAGAHNIHNAMAAAALGAYFGLTAEQIAEALEASVPVEGRQTVLETAQGAAVIDDSYNANPDSMRASLAAFRAREVVGKRLAVLGDMGELGPYSEEGHALVGREVASSGIDVLICVGTLAQGIAQVAQDAGMDAHAIMCVEDAAAALEAVRPLVTEGDCVLVKASHSVGLDAVAKGLVNAHV